MRTEASGNGSHICGGHMPAPTVLIPLLFADLPSTPETALCTAVLEDAMRCFQHRPPWSKEYVAARHWLWTEGEEDHPFSFVAICAVLRLDPQQTRRAIEAGQEEWPDAQPPKPSRKPSPPPVYVPVVTQNDFLDLQQWVRARLA